MEESKKPNFFPTQRKPRIYAYTDTRYPNCIKIGYTERTAEERVREQMESVKLPSQSWQIVLDELAMRDDGSFFTDHNIHKRLAKMPSVFREKGEWFHCSLDDLRAVIIAEKKQIYNVETRSADFKMRPEQQEAVRRTAEHFRQFEGDKHRPHFLWNAKMRFGKTFAAYQLAKEMGWKKVLILTFKPAVQSAWQEDLENHIDFEGWQFLNNKDGVTENDIDRQKPFVFFGSFQDILGKNKSTGGFKPKNQWIGEEDWDCVIFDEYHYGAWRDKNKEVFADRHNEAKRIIEFEIEEQKELEKEIGDKEKQEFDATEEDLLLIKTNHYLYLSGTPFRAIASGEFIEDQIFNWTYTDEQRAKEQWDNRNGENPYRSLPCMVMLTYQLPDHIRKIAEKGEFNEFDLNVFFSAKGTGKNAQFEYEQEVQSWLDIIRGQYKATTEEQLKQGNKRPPMPFSDTRLKGILQHSFWFLPNVAACHAMKNLLAQPQNSFYHHYEVIVCAGKEAGIGVEALKPVQQAMKQPLETQTITLSCGKLTTGVSVPAWSGILMLRNTTSPETYFQTMFRVQTPWVVKNPDKTAPNREEIIKPECYVFDFAINRALKQIASYSNELSIDPNSSPEQKIADIIHFLPILAYDGNQMKKISPSEILDITTSGTTATLLARRWESALLVNVDNMVLRKLLDNPEAMRIIMSIEGFRGLNLNKDLETIINKSEAIKNVKKEATEKGEELSKTKKEEIKKEEKEIKDRRKVIQEKLIKFATRIPVFMYLSEYREWSLRDVITQLEPELFQKVTGITVQDFELLEKIGLFNRSLMDEAILKFRRYEEASLSYTGIYRHKDARYIGGFDTQYDAEEIREVL